MDSLGAAPAKKGKPALKAASLEPWFQTFYADFAAEHGEAAGSWHDFMATVEAMLKQSAADGNKISDVKGWMNGTFSWDAYAAALADVQSAERSG